MRSSTLLLLWPLALTALVNAAVMDFTTAPTNATSTSYVQNGIRLTLLSGHYDVFDCTMFPCRGSFGVYGNLDRTIQSGPSTVRIALDNGAAFRLDSISFPISPATLLVQYTNSMTSSTGTVLRFLAPGDDPGPTLTAPAGFQAITYFDLFSDVDIAPAFTFDDISVTEIPEPAPGPLVMLAALATLTKHRLKTAPR